MSRQSEAVKRYRKKLKNKIVESMGGGCCICGYNKSHRALDLHHINPEDKEFSLSSVMAHPIKWEKVVPELRKCVLLCSLCHAELHDGLIELPINICGFNEAFSKGCFVVDKDICPVCGGDKDIYNITCSRKCANLKIGSVKWGNIDLEKLIEAGLSYKIIGDIFGVSDQAVVKRIKSVKNDSYLHFNRYKGDRPLKEDLLTEHETATYVQMGEKYGVTEGAVRHWIKIG